MSKFHNATGFEFPWIYRREFVGNNQIVCDCVSPLEPIIAGDMVQVNLPFENISIKCTVEIAQHLGDAPGVWQFKEYQKNSYYKLTLKYEPYGKSTTLADF